MKANKIRQLLFFMLSLTFLLFLFNSCVEDYWDPERISDEVELNPGIAAPLAYGSLSLQDILNETDSTEFIGQFEDGPDAGLLYIVFGEELFSYPASEIIDIPDQSFLEFFISTEVDIPAWQVSTLGDTITYHKQNDGVFVTNNNMRLDSIDVQTLDLDISVTSSFEHTGILTIYSDSLLVDGEPFRETIKISDASGNFSFDTTINMNDQFFYLDNSNPDTTILPLEFELKLINSGNAIESDQSCDIIMYFNNISFNAVYGYAGDFNLLLSEDVIEVDVYSEDFDGGDIFFADPRLTLNVANSYGVPVLVELSDVSTYSTINDVTTPITFTGVNPFEISAPEMNEIGDTVMTTIEITNENVNINEALETSPSYFYYTASAVTNPAGPEASDNFILADSELKVDFEVLLPMHVNADGFGLEDTLDFDFREQFGDDLDIIDYFRLTLDAENGLPMDVQMQIYFTDESYQVLDSLFLDDDLLLEGAEVNDSDQPVDKKQKTKAVEFTYDRLQSIKPSKYLLIRAEIYTTESTSGYVKFFAEDAIDYSLSLKADLSINSRD